MAGIPETRKNQILAWLKETQTLSIDELAQRLNVSGMTIHRDLKQLERDGYVQKLHGGVTLAPSQNKVSIPLTLAHCKLCNMPLSGRTTMVIQKESGEQDATCCPHCGFLLLDKTTEPVASILAKDFLYAHMINARQAIYLINSEIRLCCFPNVLCFATLQDAQRFQAGFGGETASFDETHAYLLTHH